MLRPAQRYDDFKLIRITCKAACHGKTEPGILIVVLIAGVCTEIKISMYTDSTNEIKCPPPVPWGSHHRHTTPIFKRVIRICAIGELKNSGEGLWRFVMENERLLRGEIDHAEEQVEEDAPRAASLQRVGSRETHYGSHAINITMTTTITCVAMMMTTMTTMTMTMMRRMIIIIRRWRRRRWRSRCRWWRRL